MKNCLIVILVLIGCALIAGYLVLALAGAAANDPRRPHMIATWRCFEDNDDVYGIEVAVGTDRMDIDVPAIGQAKRTEVKGRWSRGAFFVDSHLDSPPEILVAEQLKNEDLQIDIGRYIPAHPAKIVCVKTWRQTDPRPPYPVADASQKVSYPPPKGLIRVGMLKCDLDTLPWLPDRSDYEATPSGGAGVALSPEASLRASRETPLIYTYHSDRPDASNLIVTIYNGRVTEVNGGAEETADIPYQLPPPAPPADQAAMPQAPRSWGEWLFDLIFTK